MKREGLEDKLAETLLEIKVDTLDTLLSEIRAKALMGSDITGETVTYVSADGRHTA